MYYHRISTINILLLSCLGLLSFSKEGPGIQISTKEKNINCIRFSSGGSLLAFGDGNSVKVVRMTDLQLVSEMKDGHSGKILSLDFSADSSMIVSGGSDSLIIVWNLKTNEIRKLNYHTGKVTAVKFDQKAGLIYSGSTDRRIVCYSLTEGKIMFDIKVHTAEVLALDLTVDGKFLASSGADKSVYIIDTRDGKIINNLSGQNSWIRCLKFNNNSTTLSTGSDKGTIFFWNTTDPLNSKLILKRKKLMSWVTSVDFFSDNTSYCYSLDNGKVGIELAGVDYRLKLKYPVRMAAIQPGNRTFFKIAVATYGNGLIIIDGNSFID
jgi:WD40 repeat protein